MTPLPTLDISSPEAARESIHAILGWRGKARENVSNEILFIADLAHRGLYLLSLPAAHESPALKQLVQDAIDKLRAMLAENGHV